MARTVSWKLVLALAMASLTVMVMAARPVWPESGLMVTVRLASMPPKKIFVLVISEGLDELA